MTRERLIQLLTWADATKWPKWEQVMYHNNVTVTEACLLWLILSESGDDDAAPHVYRGITAFTGKHAGFWWDGSVLVGEVEDELSMGSCGWDMIPPSEVIGAVIRVLGKRGGTSLPDIDGVVPKLSDTITDEMVEVVEQEVGMSSSAWDMVDPKLIISAAIKVAFAEEDGA